MLAKSGWNRPRQASIDGILLTGTGIRVSVWKSHAFPQPFQLALQSFIPLEQVLHRLVAILLALELLQLAFKPFNVFLRPCPDGTLGLTIICSLAGKL